MGKIRVGLIRVLSQRDPQQVERHGHLLEETFPSLKVISRAIEGFPHGIYDHRTEEKAIPEIVRVAEALVGQVDAIAVSCVADPGLDELRRRFSLPVVGAGSSLGWASRSLGRKVGVLTITEGLPRPLEAALRAHPHLWKHVEGVGNTTDLEGAGEGIVRAAGALVDQGCDVIALGCTGFSTLGIARLLWKKLGIPVLDPVITMGATLISGFYPLIARRWCYM